MDFEPSEINCERPTKKTLGVHLSLVSTRNNVFGQRDIYGCVQILKVLPSSAASRAELRPGDIIVEVDGIPVPKLPGAGKDTVSAFVKYWSSLDDVEIVKLVLVRNKSEHELNVML